MINKPLYSIVIPVYNSKSTLSELLNRVDEVMKPYESYEILCIDDFSTDGSWEELLKLKKERNYIKLFRLTRNFGQSKATICGIRQSRADIVITIDDDLQYPPEEIPKLIERFSSDNKYLIFGVPKDKKANWWHKVLSKVVEYVINIFMLRGNTQRKIRFSTFKILSKKIYNREVYNESAMRSLYVFFNMVSPLLMDYIYVNHEPRKKGKSNYNFIKKLLIMFELVIVTTQFPLYLFLIFFLLYIILLITLLTLNIWGAVNLQDLSLLAFFTLLPINLLGFIFLFGYAQKIFKGYMGEEVYAIWEEA